MFVQSDLETVTIILYSHSVQTFSHAFSVTEFAAWAYLGTPCDRVPSVFCPFDRRLAGHISMSVLPENRLGNFIAS